ncbi:hypothetical protein P7C70_g8421, partial [Phenoliferia sp. Uapishka_3]
MPGPSARYSAPEEDLPTWSALLHLRYDVLAPGIPLPPPLSADPIACQNNPGLRSGSRPTGSINMLPHWVALLEGDAGNSRKDNDVVRISFGRANGEHRRDGCYRLWRILFDIHHPGPGDFYSNRKRLIRGQPYPLPWSDKKDEEARAQRRVIDIALAKTWLSGVEDKEHRAALASLLGIDDEDNIDLKGEGQEVKQKKRRRNAEQPVHDSAPEQVDVVMAGATPGPGPRSTLAAARLEETSEADFGNNGPGAKKKRRRSREEKRQRMEDDEPVKTERNSEEELVGRPRNSKELL